MSGLDYATLTSKGQITIPKMVREALALRAGDQVAFAQQPDHTFVLIPRNADIRSLKGIVKRTGRSVSLAEMDTAVAQGAVRRGNR